MPPIKLNSSGKVVTKNGNPSCTCCEPDCNFTIYALLEYLNPLDEESEVAKIYIVNNSSSPLGIISIVYQNNGSTPSLDQAIPPFVDGNTVFILTLDESFYIQGLYLVAQTSCGEIIFDIPYGT
jgi:hypothetical protein